MDARSVARRSRSALCVLSAIAVGGLVTRGASPQDLAGSAGAAPLRVAIGPVTPPLLDLDPDGQMRGFVPDLIEEAARRAGLAVEFEAIGDETALTAVTPGAAPLLVWLQGDQVPQGYIALTRGFLSMNSAVFRREAPRFGREMGASELGEIIVVEGSETQDDLRGLNAGILFAVPTVEEAFRRLAAGAHDTVVVDDFVGQYALRSMRLSSIVQVPAPGMQTVHSLRLLRAQDRPDLEAVLVPHFESMRRDGGYTAIYDRWFAALSPRTVPAHLFGFTLATAAAVTLGLLLTAFVFRRRLSRIVGRRDAQLAAIMEASPSGIFRLDLEGRVTFANQEATRITGIENGPIDARRWLDAVHPDDRAAVSVGWKSVAGSQGSDDREFRFVHPDGEIVWVLDRAVPERDASGRVIGFIGTLTDITRLKQAQETIRTHSAVLMSMAEGVGFTDSAGNILYTNAAFDAMYCYGPGELLGQPVSILSNRSSEQTARRTQEVMNALRDTGRWQGEFRSRRKDGTPMDVRARMTRIEGAGEAFAVSVQEDITEAKRAQEDLRQSEEKFRRVAGSALVGISLFDGTRFTFANDAMVALSGYDPAELAGLDRERLVDLFYVQEDSDRVVSALRRLEEGDAAQGHVVVGDVRLRRKSGEVRWTWLSVARLFPESPYPRMFVCVDTTERHLSQDALRESEEKFRRIAESALVGIAITDEGRFTFSNAAMVELTGYRPEDVNSFTREDITRLLLSEGLQASVHQALVRLDDPGVSPEPVVIEEARLRHRDGADRWARLTVSRLFPDRPFPRLFVAVDITARKRAEQSVRTHSHVLMSMAEGVVITDDAGVILETNPAFDAMFGYGPRELIGEPITVLGDMPAGEVEQFSRAIDADIAAKGSWTGVFRDKRKDGSRVWTRARLTQTEINGRKAYVSVQEDITEAKRVEEALRDNEALFRAISEQMPDALLLVDFGGKERGGRVLYANSAAARMHGMTLEEIIGRPIAELDATMSRQEVSQIVARLRAGEMLQYESAHRRADGSVFPVEVSARTIEALGTTVILSIDRDITGRKRAEAELRDSEQRLRTIVESEPECVKLLDENAVLLDMNPAGLAMVEAGSIEQVRGVNTLDLVAPESREIFLQTVDEAFAGRATLREFEIIGLRGTRRWMEQHAVPLWDLERPGRVKQMLAVTRDVTARRHAEAALRESETRLALIFNSTSDLQILFRVESPDRYIVEATNRAHNEYLNGVSGGRVVDIVGRERGEYLADLGVPAETIVFGRARYREAVERREAVSYSSPFVVGGTTVQIEVSLVPILCDEGRCTHLLWSGRDVTEKARAEAALRESEERFRGVAESALVGIAIVDGERYTYLNDSILELTGYGREELMSTGRAARLAAIFTPEDARRIAEAAARADAATGGVPVSRFPELRLQRKDGTERWVSLFVSPMYPERPYPALIVVVDITERKLAEDALRTREDSLRRTEEMALIGGWEFRADGKSGGWSDGVRRIHDVPADYQPTLESGLAFFSSTDRQTLLTLAGDAMRTGTPWKFEGQLTTAKGRRIWVRSTGEPIRENGQIVGLVGAMQDVTELRKAEASLRESEALFRAISEQMPDALFLLDLDDSEVPGRILYANEAAARQHGYTLEELVGLSISQLDSPETARQIPDRLARLRAGETIHFEGGHRRKDGTEFPVEVVARKIPAFGGNVVLAIDRDISERRNAEQERSRIEARMQQAQRLESLGVLTGGIAHDFNNLLAGILGQANLARADAPATGSLRESIEQIEVAARRAADLVHQMLTYSGRGSFVVRRVQLGTMIRELAKLFEVTLSKKATLLFDLDDSAPPILADAVQIQQVVMNLITNASDALGDQPGTIRLSSGAMDYTEEALREFAPHDPPPPGPYVYLEVTDTGCGMDAATLDRIFDPFFSTKFTGRGLGLAAALGIVRGHRGGLRVTSRLGQGTTFRVIFPAAPGDFVAEDDTGDTPAPGRSGTVLIVDDEPQVRDFLVRALQRFGHETLVAVDGRQALEVFDRYRDRIDAVLLDITMPEMSGGEVLQALHARRPELPVILMSGFTEAETRSRLEHNGFGGFLQKPFSLDSLRNAIAKVID